MKYTITLIVLAFLLSCAVGKTDLPQKTDLHVMLGQKVKPATIVADYPEITELKPASRSQPLFLTTVNLKEADLKKLINKLETDERVVSVKILEKEANTNSTNTGFGTASPKNQNQ